MHPNFNILFNKLILFLFVFLYIIFFLPRYGSDVTSYYMSYDGDFSFKSGSLGDLLSSLSLLHIYVSGLLLVILFYFLFMYFHRGKNKNLIFYCLFSSYPFYLHAFNIVPQGYGFLFFVAAIVFRNNLFLFVLLLVISILCHPIFIVFSFIAFLVFNKFFYVNFLIIIISPFLFLYYFRYLYGFIPPDNGLNFGSVNILGFIFIYVFVFISLFVVYARDVNKFDILVLVNFSLLPPLSFIDLPIVVLERFFYSSTLLLIFLYHELSLPKVFWYVLVIPWSFIVPALFLFRGGVFV